MGSETKTFYEFGPFRVDPDRRQLLRENQPVPLQPKAFDTLLALIQRSETLVSKDELMQAVWPDAFVEESNLTQNIFVLRKTLGEAAGQHRFIVTVPGRGYRFAERVRLVPEDGDILVLNRSSTEVVIDEEASPDKDLALMPKNTQVRTIAVLSAIAVLALAGYWAWQSLRPAPFQKFTVMQVTNSGKATGAAVSPDGRYVLSVMDDGGGQSLWLRNVPTGSDTEILPPSPVHYAGLTFSPDGNYIYFREAQNAIQTKNNLYRSPVLGGTPQEVVGNIDSDITFSPDGKRIAYVRQHDPDVEKYRVLAASVEGTNETVLQTGSRSEAPNSLAWSRKGDEIFYSLYLPEQGTSAIDILAVTSGKSHRWVTFKDKFLDEIQWSPDGRALFAVYRETGANFRKGQIGFLQRAGGEIVPITRDTNSYRTLTISADGKSLATVLARTSATVSVLSDSGQAFVGARAVLSRLNEFDTWSVLSWAAGGDLLLSNTGHLSKLGIDGKSEAQLLADPSALIITPSPCGKDYLVLSWEFHEDSKQSIWRADADGSNPIRLTDGKGDAFPVCSPDQKWVYYMHWVDGSIYRVPLDGSGKAEAVSAIPQGYFLTMGGLSVSPDGKRLATVIGGGGAEAAIVLFDLGSPSPPQIVDASHYVRGVQFTPDGKSIAYVARENGGGNVWVQPLDGTPGHPLTDFTSEQIWSFCLSSDGKRLGILRGHFDSDVVLLQEPK